MICVAILVMYCISQSGCGSTKNAIVGNWQNVNGYEYEKIMRFYDDGTCLNVPHWGLDEKVLSYKLQEDGMLFLSLEYGDTITLEPAKNEEEALKDQNYYYLSEKKTNYKENRVRKTIVT